MLFNAASLLKAGSISPNIFYNPDMKVRAIRSCFFGSIALPFRAGILEWQTIFLSGL